MKSMMIAVMAVVVGLSTGCARMEYAQNPDNYRVNPLNGQRMYCHGDQRDNYTVCEGWQTREQIARKVEQEKIAEENARIAAEKQAMRYGTTKEREALVYASINRVRVAQGDKLIDNSGGYAKTEEERELLAWAEAPNVTIAEMKNTLRVREIKMIAQARVDAENWKKIEAAEKRQAAVAAKKWEAFEKKAKAEYAAKQKAKAAALEAARIERRDHPEIGAKRDLKRLNNQMIEAEAKEDVYRATHNGKSELEESLEVFERDNRKFIADQKLRQDLGLKPY